MGENVSSHLFSGTTRQQQEVHTMHRHYLQEAITQQMAALATQLAEQPLQQEQARQQLLEQFT